jgi:protein 1.7 protein
VAGSASWAKDSAQNIRRLIMTNSIISIIEDLLDELEDLAYEHNTDLLTAKRNEINFAIKHLLCDDVEDDENDMVNSPADYKLGGLDIESKDVLKSVLGTKGYVHWACGNAMKYIFRWEKKNGLEDLKKSQEKLRFCH